MITRRTKVQLLVFALITVIGVTYVGAKYARLDRVFFDDTYTVTAHYPEPGGIFTDAEVTYRGVGVGTVAAMELTDSGVDVVMDIDKDYDQIPADSLAVVGNRSAVGEQYVELQPQVDQGPYLEEGSEIAQDRTEIPIATDTLLTNLDELVRSVDQEALHTSVAELGAAFDGTGRDLQQIIDTSNSFIELADANFDTTTALIRDSNVVLQGQADKASAIRTFSRNLELFSGTLAGSDKDLRAVIDNGSAAANQLRTFLEENEVDLAELINNLVTTGEVVVRRLDGIEQMLVIYPYVVEGGFTVVSKNANGLYDAHFGLVLTTDPPVCHRGYESTDRRPPQDGANRPMNEEAGCAEPPSVSNPRGAQNAPRPGTGFDSPVVGSYDPESGTLTWGEDRELPASAPGSLPPASMGEESWTWLYLRPLMSPQD